MTQLSGGSTVLTDCDRTAALIPLDARPGEFLVDLVSGWSALVGVQVLSVREVRWRSGFTLGDDDWFAGPFEIDDSTGGLAVEHGRLTQMDRTVVADSFHTWLNAQN